MFRDTAQLYARGVLRVQATSGCGHAERSQVHVRGTAREGRNDAGASPEAFGCELSSCLRRKVGRLHTTSAVLYTVRYTDRRGGDPGSRVRCVEPYTARTIRRQGGAQGVSIRHAQCCHIRAESPSRRGRMDEQGRPAVAKYDALMRGAEELSWPFGVRDVPAGVDGICQAPIRRRKALSWERALSVSRPLGASPPSSRFVRLPAPSLFRTTTPR